MDQQKRLFIIDSIGPFVKPGAENVNWSSVPFFIYENLEKPETEFRRIVSDFELFAKKAKEIGYNAISIDDLAHMVSLDMYGKNLRAKLKKFKKLYLEILSICRQQELKVFVNFDIMFFNEEILAETKKDDVQIISVLKELITLLFSEFEVDGVITRIGEPDGLDVKGIFKSEVVVKTPKQANWYIRQLLPLFERHDKTWIFRIWTLGMGRIGDLMWNKKTYHKVFSTIESRHFIVSMKFGESDFFRNIELNPLLKIGRHQKIIELQAKREYDGYGELPFYTGWDYETYYHQTQNSNLSGIMVWCQTGGWHSGNRITFLHNSSPWVELNAISTLNIFHGESADKQITDFFRNKDAVVFLEKYYSISHRIMQPSENKRIYFRKTRIPPAIWNFWGNIMVNSATATFVSRFYKTPPKVGRNEINELYLLGKKINMPEIEFIKDTLDIFYDCRICLHGNNNLEELKKSASRYSGKYPDFLKFYIGKKAKANRFYYWIFKFMLRDTKGYRIRDVVLLNSWVLRLIFRGLSLINKNLFPDFSKKQAIGIKSFFR